MTDKERKVVDGIKENLSRINDLKTLLYFEEQVDSMFEDEEQNWLVRVAIKEYVQEKGWDFEYALSHFLNNIPNWKGEEINGEEK